MRGGSGIDKLHSLIEDVIDGPSLALRDAMLQVEQVTNLIASAKETVNIALRVTGADTEPDTTRNERRGRISNYDSGDGRLAVKHQPMEHVHFAGVEQEQWYNRAVVVAIRDESELLQPASEIAGIEGQSAKSVMTF